MKQIATTGRNMHKNAVRAPQMMNSFQAKSDLLLLSNNDSVVTGSDETENKYE